MVFWKRKGVQEVQRQIQDVLMHSFNQVRRDVQNVYEWLRFLHDQNQQQQRLIEDLRQELVLMPKNKAEIRDLIDAHYSLDPILERVAEIEGKLSKYEESDSTKEHSELFHKSHELMSKSHAEMISKLHEISTKMDAAQPQPAPQVVQRPQTSHLQEKIIRNVTRNSKRYIKNILIQTITKYDNISGLQLREIIVNEQGLVSRSSFYRLLLELESEGQVTVTQQGKEKIYMPGRSEIVTV